MAQFQVLCCCVQAIVTVFAIYSEPLLHRLAAMVVSAQVALVSVAHLPADPPTTQAVQGPIPELSGNPLPYSRAGQNILDYG